MTNLLAAFVLILVKILLLILLFLLLGQMFVAYFLIKVPTINSKKAVLKKIAGLGLKPGSTFMDLGCNDGRFIGELAKLFPDCRFIGVEKNIFSIFLAKLNNKIFYRNKLTIKNENIFQTDLSEADYLYLYLWPEVMEKLRPHILKRAKKGAMIICNSFPLEGARPSEVIPSKKPLETLYLYRL